jgi:biotin carboxyl carrier protein
MKRYQITLDGRTFDVLLLSDPLQEQVKVEVDGAAFTAEVRALSPGEEPAAEPAAPADPSGPAEPPASTPLPDTQTAAIAGNSVAAPLPGVIKSIAVRPGQQVSIGDELLVIEAMKMDNAIRASRDGTVETIHVTEGRQVAYGERLLEYLESGPI